MSLDDATTIAIITAVAALASVALNFCHFAGMPRSAMTCMNCAPVGGMCSTFL
ncbi:hypothetical protein [Saccharopolyspora spinosa]|uniref:hypothetical protein n=1 Tax=Saccharopolyspora spinosa TaxID=60894 RepID=UPI003B428B89